MTTKNDKLFLDLVDAICAGNCNQVSSLISSGVDVQRQLEERVSLLHLACRNISPKPEIILSLLQARADVNAIDAEGNSPLHDLVRQAIGRSSMLQAPSPSAIGGIGSLQSLLGSLMKGHQDMISGAGVSAPQFAESASILLRSGANPSIQNNEGMTPLAFAQAENNTELIRILVAAGATLFTSEDFRSIDETRQSAARSDEGVYFQLEGESEIRFFCSEDNLLTAHFSFGYDEEELGKPLLDHRLNVQYRDSESDPWCLMEPRTTIDGYYLVLQGPKLDPKRRKLLLRVEYEDYSPADLGEVAF